MTSRVMLLSMVLLGLAGISCSTGPPAVGARLGSPLDVVAFSGVTSKNPGLHGYLAVASSRNNDVAIIDPADDQPVLGPAVVFPLSIPTDPHPLRLAAAPLGDGATGGADLLVVMSAGSLDLQVVETWTAENRVSTSASVPLAPLLGGADLLAVAALTAPGAGPGNPRARALVAATGGRLVVVDFTRDPQTGGVVPQQPVVKSIGLDPVALAVEPGGTRVFMASADPIAGAGSSAVFGVGLLDAGADPATAWPVTALDAKAPTLALAVSHVRERLVDSANPSAPDTFQTASQLRVYALLDPSGCGPDRAITCGVATLDEHGLVPDPAGELPFRAPIPVSGLPAGIAVALPPASGASLITTDPNNPGVPLMAVQPGARNTSAIAAVTSSDGGVYTIDLGRYSPVNTLSTVLASGTGVGATSAAPLLAPGVSVTGNPDQGKVTQLGFWSDFPVPPPAGSAVSVVIDPARMPSLLQVTPGYTIADQWFITWQGELPSLVERRGVVGRAADGEVYAAIQANVGTPAQPSWVVGVGVGDPSLGIHGSDAVVIVPDDALACPASAGPAHPYPEPTVATDIPILAPDPTLFPGGAIHLATGSCFEAGLAPGQVATAAITVRASGLVLTSHRLGYLGRPAFDRPFLLQYQDETGLTGEALAIARKVRRSFYPVEGPCPAGAAGQPAPGCYPGYPWLADPLAPGPALAFRVGLLNPGLPAGAPPLDPTDPATLANIARDTAITIQTQAGLTPASFQATYGGVLPSAVIAYDRTAIPGHADDATRVYAVFLDDQLIGFSPSVVGGDLTNIR